MTFEEVCKMAIVDGYERLMAENARLHAELELSWDFVQEEATECDNVMKRCEEIGSRLADADAKLHAIDDLVKAFYGELADQVRIVLHG